MKAFLRRDSHPRFGVSAAALGAAVLLFFAWGCRAIEEEAVIRITPEGTFEVEIVSRFGWSDGRYKPEDVERRDAALRDYENGADSWTLLLRDAGAENLLAAADYADGTERKLPSRIHRRALLRSTAQLDKLFARDALAFRLYDDERRGLRVLEVIAFARPEWSREEREALDGLRKNLPGASADFLGAMRSLYRYWSRRPDRLPRFDFFFESDGDPGQFPERVREAMRPGASEAGGAVPEEILLNAEETRLLSAYAEAAKAFFELYELDGTQERAVEKCCPSSIPLRIEPPAPAAEALGFSAWEALEKELAEEECRGPVEGYVLCPVSPLEVPLFIAARCFSPAPMRWKPEWRSGALLEGGFRESLPPEAEIRRAVESAFEFVPLYRLAWKMEEEEANLADEAPSAR
jgi:hypothetical protein